jgi:hypothetical protein
MDEDDLFGVGTSIKLAYNECMIQSKIKVQNICRMVKRKVCRYNGAGFAINISEYFEKTGRYMKK